MDLANHDQCLETLAVLDQPGGIQHSIPICQTIQIIFQTIEEIQQNMEKLRTTLSAKIEERQEIIDELRQKLTDKEGIQANEYTRFVEEIAEKNAEIKNISDKLRKYEEIVPQLLSFSRKNVEDVNRDLSEAIGQVGATIVPSGSYMNIEQNPAGQTKAQRVQQRLTELQNEGRLRRFDSLGDTKRVSWMVGSFRTVKGSPEAMGQWILAHNRVTAIDEAILLTPELDEDDVLISYRDDLNSRLPKNYSREPKDPLVWFNAQTAPEPDLYS